MKFRPNLDYIGCRRYSLPWTIA